MHRVIETFRDTEHNAVYQKGDAYPAPGKDTTPERIAYLSGTANMIGRPVIELVEPTSNRRRGATTALPETDD